MDVGELSVFPEIIRTARFDLVLKPEEFDFQDAGYLDCPEKQRQEYLNSSICQGQTKRSSKTIPKRDNNPALFSIWNKEELVGNIVLTPDDESSAEINFWLADEFRGKGYATLATRGLSNYLAQDFSAIYAQVDSINTAAAAVLKRSGFSEIAAQETGKLIFSFGVIIGDSLNKDNQDQSKEERQILTANIPPKYQLPSRQDSLCGRFKDGDWAYLSHGIARKLYSCFCCRDRINIGSEHVILSLVKPKNKYDHHHLHSECVEKTILPSLHAVRQIPAKETTPESMGKRRRRFKRAAKRRGY